jgi:hypothetical protein
MDKHEAKAAPWYRFSFMWLVVALPLVSVVLGIGLLVVAIRTDDGLVADDYYRRGKEINLVLARDRAAAALGLSADLEIDAVTGLVRARLRSTRGAEMPAQIELKFMHATRAGFDQTLALARTPAGFYQAGAGALAPGRWDVELAAADWRLVGELRAPAGTRAELRPGALAVPGAS